jgi:hypothetical protein
MADLYRLLGISRRADGPAIRASYYRLAKQFHPDANAGVEAGERFREITIAYETLSNPVARAEYDQQRVGQRSRRRTSFWVGALAGLSAFGILLGMLPMFLQREEPTPAERSSPSRAESAAAKTVDQVASIAATKDMDCHDLIKADLAFRVIDGPPQSLPLVSCAAELPPRAEARPQVLAYLEREHEELAYGPVAPERKSPPHDLPLATQGLSVVPERGPAILPKPAHWTLLENAGAGFELKYPSDVFSPRADPDEADDRLFVSRDGHSVLRIYSTRSVSGMALSKYRASLLAQRYAGASLDYAPQREHWFVLSGSLGAEMFYERVSFSCDRRSYHGWLITYPVVERQYYDAIVEEIHRSYRYGKQAGWRCGGSASAADGARQ